MYKIAIAGASTLLGRELKDAISESPLAAATFVLLDEEEAQGQLDQVGDEVTFIQTIGPDAFDKVDFTELKRNTAIAAVTVFGIAERAEPLAPRQSRSEIDSLLKATGLEGQMKSASLWSLWESGERGRMP